MERFPVAVIQMQVQPDRDDNLARADRLVEEAARGGAKLVVLPEMFTCPYELAAFHPNAERLDDGPTSRLLSAAAARHGIWLAGGSFPERRDEGVYNTATLFGPNGDLELVHRKVHLFDIDIPGGITFMESACLSAGDSLEIVETKLAQIGLAICYDLRFPEVFRSLVLAGAELVILPGAFNTTTGPAHWEPLLRARAIENTCYVVACSPAPHPEGSYPAHGHSMVVDPYGRILTEAGRDETILRAEIGGERLREVRRALPVIEQRRPEVYRLA